MKSLMHSRAQSFLPILLSFTALTSSEHARAECGLWAGDFGQLATNCGDDYCYVVSPGSGTAQTLAGTFWSFGTGNPTLAQGDDSGAWPVADWLFPSGSGRILVGGWYADAAIDGCISGHVAPGKTAEIMAAMLSDETSGGAAESFFALASARRIIAGGPEFDFTFVNGGGLARNIELVPIPTVRITGLSRPLITLHLAGPSLSDVSPGIYGDGSLAPEEVVKGYRVYVSSGTTVTSLRTSDGWTAVSGIVPLGQGFDYAVGACPPAGVIRLGLTLVFDGNFETAHVGKYATVNCRYCADADGDGFYDLFGDPECCPINEVCDCNDLAANVHPFAVEQCNGVDDNCNGAIDDVGLPGPVASVQLDKQPGTTGVDWPALAEATGYDVVRGDLTTLLAGGGSYADATDVCVADDVAANHTDDPLDPGPDSGFWYLIRAGNCIGVGSYDGPGASQVAPRDPGIAASGVACP
jgi:hypothetical protein